MYPTRNVKGGCGCYYIIISVCVLGLCRRSQMFLTVAADPFRLYLRVNVCICILYTYCEHCRYRSTVLSRRHNFPEATISRARYKQSSRRWPIIYTFVFSAHAHRTVIAAAFKALECIHQAHGCLFFYELLLSAYGVLSEWSDLVWNLIPSSPLPLLSDSLQVQLHSD